jgi:hypothetical protein
MVMVLGLTLGVGQARAQIFLDIPNSDLSGETGPFAKVSLSDKVVNNVNEVTFTVTAIDQPGSPKGTATINDFSFNGPTGATLDSSTTLPSGWTLTPNPDNSTADFGKFGYIVGDGGNSSSVTTVTFTMDNLTSSQVLSGLSNKGYHFAAHYFPNNGGSTGFAGALVVPEPGPFVGAGVVTLIGLGYFWLRRRRPGRPAS